MRCFLTFDIALHFGTLLAIGIFFFKDFIAMFRDGFKFKGNDGKLSFKHVKGGVNLIETEFTIKEDKKLKNTIKNFNNVV